MFQKALITLLSIIGICTVLRAQEIEVSEIPQTVLDEFNLVYPDARNIQWHFTHPYYVAEFRNNKMETMAIMSRDGDLTKTETEIKTTALPLEALGYLDNIETEEKIEWASITEDHTGMITFEAIMDKKAYIFDSNGQLLASQGGIRRLPD